MKPFIPWHRVNIHPWLCQARWYYHGKPNPMLVSHGTAVDYLQSKWGGDVATQLFVFGSLAHSRKFDAKPFHISAMNFRLLAPWANAWVWATIRGYDVSPALSAIKTNRVQGRICSCIVSLALLKLAHAPSSESCYLWLDVVRGVCQSKSGLPPRLRRCSYTCREVFPATPV